MNKRSQKNAIESSVHKADRQSMKRYFLYSRASRELGTYTRMDNI